MDDQKHLEKLQRVFKLQKGAQETSGSEGYKIRKSRLDRVIELTARYENELCEAMDADFVGRHRILSLGLDFAPSIIELKHARKNLKHWMKPQKRSSNFPLGLIGGKSSIIREPKGVVGNISTWNFPVFMTLGPLAGIFAGGNRCILKTSDLNVETAKVLNNAVRDFFDEDEFAVIEGGVEVSSAFSALNFDHILFTGSTRVGKLVMASAAENLTPVTLELGGKCPIFVSRSADIEKVAARVIYAKMTNAGQICLAPDYVMIATEYKDEFIKKLTEQAKIQFPDATNNGDYTAIISDSHVNRLTSLIVDATNKGAKVEVVDMPDVPTNNKKIPLHILENVSDDMVVMQEEIFGPILPIITYNNFEEAITSLKGKEKPLASYYFGSDENELGSFIKHVPSGSTTVNDVMFHAIQPDLPFGGVGASGMGQYHAIEGFQEFTNPRAIYKQAWIDVGRFFRPPFNKASEFFIRQMM